MNIDWYRPANALDLLVAILVYSAIALLVI